MHRCSIADRDTGQPFCGARNFSGLTVLVVKSRSQALKTEGVAKSRLGDFVFGQLQTMSIWWLIVTAMYIFVVHNSRFGNWIFTLGSNKFGARNAGILTGQLTITLFGLSATSAAFVGMCQVIRYNSAQVAGGQSFIFNSIIAVVVGEVSLTGGFGSITGIFFGTLTFAIMKQDIYYTAFDHNWSSLIIGVLLLLAVLMNNTLRNAALTHAPRKKVRTST